MTEQNKAVKPGTEEWESICQRCARCCYEKLDYRGKIFYTTKPCPHLDIEQNRCCIYEQRSELYPDCVHLTPELAAAGFLPADCPYVYGIINYRAPEMDND